MSPPQPSSELRLDAGFYRQETQEVARALLGCQLVVSDRVGTIVETEAYLGPEDAASHARFGRTKRSAIMYEAGGLAYVYLIYGMHHMFNVVSGNADEGGAVLVRALHIEGAPARSANGPGKLCRHMQIQVGVHNGRSLIDDGDIWIARGENIAGQAIASGPRIGVDYAGEWASEPLRYWIRNHPAVSKSR